MGCGAASKSKYAPLQANGQTSSTGPRLESMSVKELKALLAEYSVSAEGCIEKQELIEALVTHLGAEGAAAAADQRLFIPERRSGNAIVKEVDQDLPQLQWRDSSYGQEGTSAVVQSQRQTDNSTVSVRPDSLADARSVCKLLGELRKAAESLEKVLTREAEALEKRRMTQNHSRGTHKTVITLTDVQVAQDRAVAVGMLAKDAQLEEPRLKDLIREVERGSMRLAEVQLPELVGPILEQLQGILANIRGVRAANMNANMSPPRMPPRPPPPPLPPLHLQGQILAISRLQQEIASEEQDSRLRVLALANG